MVLNSFCSHPFYILCLSTKTILISALKLEQNQALELKKLQTPLYEEFYNSLNAAASPSYVDSTGDEASPRYLKLPPKSRSPSRGPIGNTSPAVDALSTGSPGSNGRRVSNICTTSDRTLKDTPSPPRNDWKGLLVDAQQEPSSPRFVMSFSFPRIDYVFLTLLC